MSIFGHAGIGCRFPRLAQRNQDARAKATGITGRLKLSDKLAIGARSLHKPLQEVLFCAVSRPRTVEKVNVACVEWRPGYTRFLQV